MKRPQAKDAIVIVMDDVEYTETCYQAGPYPADGPNGWQFTVITNVDYWPNRLERKQLLRDEKGEEVGISVDTVSVASNDKKRMRTTFITLIRDSQ